MSIFGKITLGSDPEIFLTKNDGTPWGAATTGCKGTKEEPYPAGNGAIQVDGLALEFNIAPASNVEEWVENHDEMLAAVIGYADGAGLTISEKSLLHFDEYIDTQNPDEETELLFGCDPDYNADTMEENEMPENDGSIKFRTTGGHVHVGIENWGELCPDDQTALMVASKIVMCLDLILGVPSTLLDDGAERKKLYGKAGAFRVKPYGLEYRTLSNFWVFNEDALKEIYKSTVALFEDAAFAVISEYATNNRDTIVECINKNDREAAIAICEDLNKLLGD